MSGEMNNKSLVDPDPFTIAAISISAASLVLQLVQIATQGAQLKSANSQRDIILSQIEDNTSKLLRHINTINRTVERGSEKVDIEYYDAPLRVATTTLNIAQPHHMQFQQNLGTAYGDLGNLSQWINHIIREDPAMAKKIGSRLSQGLEGTAQTLNRALERGDPIRVVITEAKNALEQLAAAIEDELRDGN